MRIALTYLEFYSGIGGWGYALEHACRSIVQGESVDDLGGGLRLRAQLLAAYDHSDLCNSVFYHNHRSSYPPPSSPPTSSSSSDDSSKRRKRNNNSDHTKPRQTPIERLTLSELESHRADVWCMSPPCQPHTRQHANQHLESKDSRSRSFLHLCQLLCDMNDETLPKLILLENVVGFEKQGGRSNDVRIRNDSAKNDDVDAEGGHRATTTEVGRGTARITTTAGQVREPEEQQSTSQKQQQQRPESSNDDGGGSFDTWRRALWKRNYLVGHFQLDPTHVGIPNNRPRHYTVAFLRRKTCQEEVKSDEAEGEIQCGQTSISSSSIHNRAKNEERELHDRKGKILQALPLFLEADNGGMSYDHLFCRESLLSPPIIHQGMTITPLSCLSSFLDVDLPPHDDTKNSLNTTATAGGPLSLTGKRKSLQIPEKVRMSSSSWCFDIASPCKGRVTSCFTHSYGKFIRGTGSILYTGGPRNIDNNNGAAHQLGRNGDDSPSSDRFQLTAPEERTYDGSWSKNLDWDLHMRYFSGTEIARLMGFPVAEPSSIAFTFVNACTPVRNQIDVSLSSSGRTPAIIDGSNEENDSLFRTFSFPTDCTMKQQWKMLGNSLNVRVAASVAEIGIRLVLNEFYSL